MTVFLIRLCGTGLLAVAFVVALLGLFSEDIATEAPKAIDPEPASLPEDSAAAPRPTRTDTYFAAITDRPLFSETRRPNDMQSPEPVEQPTRVATEENARPAPPDVQLLGILADGSSYAALLSVNGADPIWFAEGTKIGAWTIEETGADWLELTLETERMRLELFE